MPLIHNRANATRYLKLILATKGKEAAIGFGCGWLTSNVPLLHVKRTASPGGLGNELKSSEWKGDIKPNGKPAPKIAATGFLQLEGETLIIRCRGNAGQAPRLLRDYFVRGFKLKPAWSSVSVREQTDADAALASTMPAEEEALRAVSEEALRRAQDQADGGEDSEEVVLQDTPPAELEAAAPDQAATAPAEEPATASTTEAAEEASTEAVGAEPDGPGLTPGLAAGVASQAARISDHVQQLAPKIGLAVEAEGQDIADKISNWLESAVAAAPPGEQERTLENLSVRLLLMLSYTDNLRTLITNEAPEKKAKRGAGRPSRARDAGTKRLIRLEDIADGPMTAEELTDLLYHEALTLAELKPFPFDLAGYSKAKLREHVGSMWQEGLTGTALLQQAEKVRKNMQGLFRTDKGIAVALGLQPSARQTQEQALAALAARIATRWSIMQNEATASLESLKLKADAELKEVDQDYSVGALGGTWNDPDAAVSRLVTGDLDHLIADIASGIREGREAAVASAEKMVADRTALVESDPMLRLLDEAPFADGAGLRDTAIATLGQISAMLANLRSAASLQAA
ncbi:hypothetical protein [Roseomonas marmotae]|uniref:DUF3102 domain-containing protein n=1 Tax=Roseomonas marmotae TaxID=2768161 RepID=A0ABS3K8C5_9PROT|nr:hypothetical protein [Roseomonas marmotae]MBO1073726.1 hypothetical protein [Roseomonas marmotae]QTI78639.1 hypothetical protein IAI58_13315 [Roseomonas marmotae]